MTEYAAAADNSTPDPGPDYALESEEAARLVHAVVTEVSDQLSRGEINRREAIDRLGTGISAVREQHPEVDEVPTRTALVEALDPVLSGVGEDRLSPYEW